MRRVVEAIKTIDFGFKVTLNGKFHAICLHATNLLVTDVVNLFETCIKQCT